MEPASYSKARSKDKSGDPEDAATSRSRVEGTVFTVQGMRERLTLHQAVLNRDAVIIGTIGAKLDKAALSEAQKFQLLKTIEEAFDNGSQEWEQKYLKLVVGPAKASRIKRLLASRLETLSTRP